MIMEMKKNTPVKKLEEFLLLGVRQIIFCRVECIDQCSLVCGSCRFFCAGRLQDSAIQQRQYFQKKNNAVCLKILWIVCTGRDRSVCHGR